MSTKRKYFGRKSHKDLSSDERERIKDYKDRFIRWHDKQIDLLSFSINLIFTLSVAVAGFLIGNQDKCFFKDKTVFKSYSLIRTSLLMLAASATIGVAALLTRLEDFRRTTRLTKVRRRIYELTEDIKYEDITATDAENKKEEIDKLIYQTVFLGRATWLLFYLQIALFVMTVWIMTIYI